MGQSGGLPVAPLEVKVSFLSRAVKEMTKAVAEISVQGYKTFLGPNFGVMTIILMTLSITPKIKKVSRHLILMPSVVMLCVIYAKYHKEVHYAEWN
jgi:hypothetical protein